MAALLAALFVSWGASPAGAPAEGVTVDTGSGYARIVVNSEDPASVTASIDDGILTIRSERALATDAESLVERLAGYVTVGRRDGDGAYRFALNQPLTLNVSRQGTRTAIDLVPMSFQGAPPPLRASAVPSSAPVPAVNPQALPVVQVRTGEFANFTRLIFDWPSEVRYTVSRATGRVSVRFEAAARPDFRMIEERAPPWVRAPRFRLEGSALVVEFDTDAEATTQHFRAGGRIAVDVLAPGADLSAYRRVARIPLAPQASEAALSGLRPSSDTGAQPAGIAAAPPAPAPSDTAPALPATPSAAMTRDGFVLSFPQARGKAVAVFARGPITWIVLDEHPAIDPIALLANITTVVEKADIRQHENAAVLRFLLNTRPTVSVRESERALEILFSPAAAAAAAPISLARQGLDGVTVLTAPLPGARIALTLTDPDAGDRILVIPARAGRAVLSQRRYLEVTALPTAAGIALLPRADDIGARVENENLFVGRPSGLTLSSPTGGGIESEVRVQEAPEGPTFVDFVRWARLSEGDVYSALRALRASVAGAPEANIGRARLRLAQYMLAQRLAPEALGEIQLILKTDPRLAEDPQLKVMRGAAEYLMARYDDARLTLSAAVLDRDPHAALWRGLAEARLSDWMNARQHLLMAQPVIASYPAEWRAEAQLARAETALAMGDVAAAGDALDGMPQGDAKHTLPAEYLRARVMAARGQVNEAIAEFARLETAEMPSVAARATYSRVELALAAKRIKPQDAAEALERLRFRWRGDAIELGTLRLLGSLYFSEQRWREGFASLRTAALHFPTSDIARGAKDDMRNAFADLFLNGKADAMEPIQALSLFYDFIELTPIGRDGDEMIRRLADRMVAIDLLGPAEELLQHQVDQRLEGVSRAFVAAKLAAIYLIDRKPREALDVLADTRQTGLPEELNTQRRMLEARALAGVKDHNAALDLIADDGSPEAERLRADIAWQGGNWALAAARSELILAGAWQSEAALDETQRLHAMRAAVGYALAGDAARLASFRSRYAAKMAQSPDALAFAVVTEEIETSGFAVRELARKLASVETLQAFMTEFRARTNPTAPASAAMEAAAAD
jgi:hypothetical protein